MTQLVQIDILSGKLMHDIPFDYKKAVQAINFFARKNGGKITKLEVLKLIFFADRYHLRKYGRPITNDQYLGACHQTHTLYRLLYADSGLRTFFDFLCASGQTGSSLFCLTASSKRKTYD